MNLKRKGLVTYIGFHLSASISNGLLTRLAENLEKIRFALQKKKLYSQLRINSNLYVKPVKKHSETSYPHNYLLLKKINLMSGDSPDPGETFPPFKWLNYFTSLLGKRNITPKTLEKL